MASAVTALALGTLAWLGHDFLWLRCSYAYGSLAICRLVDRDCAIEMASVVLSDGFYINITPVCAGLVSLPVAVGMGVVVRGRANRVVLITAVGIIVWWVWNVIRIAIVGLLVAAGGSYQLIHDWVWPFASGVAIVAFAWWGDVAGLRTARRSSRWES